MGEENWHHSSQQGPRLGRMKVLWLVCLIALIILQDMTEAKKKRNQKKQKENHQKKPNSKCVLLIKLTPNNLLNSLSLTKANQLLTNPAGGTSVLSQNVPSASQMGKLVGFQCTCGAKIRSQQLGAREFLITRKLYQQKGTLAIGILKKLDCAWCVEKKGQVDEKKVQCKDSQTAQKCGSFCMKDSSPQCDGVITSCLNIPSCGFGASCDRKTGKCKCGKGFSGNVQLTIGTQSEYFVYPDGSDLFPSSP